MNTPKTPGQIAFDTFWNLTGSEDQWIKSHRSHSKEWERAAAAVIAHHDPLYSLKLAHKEGKAIEFKLKTEGDDCWLPVPSPQWQADECDYRLAQPWTLPAPPAGREWHRNDWTAEMLPDGWRPLLMTELDGATHYDFERLNPEISDRFAGDGWVADPDEAKTCFYRTRRPLPPAHEVKITLPTLNLQTGKWSIASV